MVDGAALQAGPSTTVVCPGAPWDLLAEVRHEYVRVGSVAAQADDVGTLDQPVDVGLAPSSVIRVEDSLKGKNRAS